MYIFISWYPLRKDFVKAKGFQDDKFKKTMEHI